MSYDFTVLIPELIGTHEQALALHNAMCEQPEGPVPDNVQRFMDELHQKYGYENDEETGFLSVAPIDGDARGAVVPTWIGSIPENRAAMLELARDHGLGLYDPQRDRLYDPRGHIQGLTVTLGDGWDVPYLSPALLSDLFDHPHPEYPWVIIERADQCYIQSKFPPDEHVEVEYRRGGPDRHYQAVTADRQLAQKVLWGWAIESADWDSMLQWEPMDFT
ncbi:MULTISPECIES: hypothetical protein [Mycolicibacterium]|uniref:Uncharacterized protein n=2 Tax=Mycolicibacterium TaxID=1866885 RepID=A0A0U1DBP7_9MYCO|nr:MULTISPECIES: hypothetical protein [Mycolicibacterium]MCV7337921.1 hypothetical protein [Mycolicibacterium senegalense]MCW1822617.1 hypothetical protein [Mycolicibacterium senegalense]MDR7291267.1 hypothetical protein [Mycolicibacterium senegalense]OBB11551.1 hypothetical protein A5718_06180 [Mycolicibacterium conceptionense]OBF08662.1 hypothetical protein A5731_03455 [Mycolicibacterium conceptionense]